MRWRLSARQQRPRARRMQFPISRAHGRERASRSCSAPTPIIPAHKPLPIRLRDIEATYVVDGQDGRLAWGCSSSTAANTQEPFAWAIASDNKTIVGADMDGYFRITLISPDSIEKCYTHNGTSPTHAIVATCHVMNRVSR